jgi:hypothetical protein
MGKMTDWILYTALVLSWSAFLLAENTVKQPVEPERLSDPVLLAIVGVLMAVVTGGFGLLQAVLLARIQKQGVAAAVKVEEVVKKAEETAVKTEEVKIALATSTESANKQLTSIHTLVNANMGAQLKISAVALRRVALSSSKEKSKEDFDEEVHKIDLAAAATAEALLAEHVLKQASVDRNEN